MRLLLIIIIFLFNFAVLSFSQNLSNPIFPAKPTLPDYLGFTLGLGQNFQSGKMYVECPGCVFEDGVRFGYTIGAFYESYINDFLTYGADINFSNNGIKTSYIENELIDVVSTEISYRESVNIPFRHISDVDISTINLIPYIKLIPWNFLFFKVGFGFNFVASSNLRHDKELLKNEVILSNGTITKVRLADTKGNLATIQDGDFKDLEKFYLTINPSVGFNIPFDSKRNVVFSPWLMYSLPLSDISKNGEAFKINQWRILFSISFKL